MRKPELEAGLIGVQSKFTKTGNGKDKVGRIDLTYSAGKGREFITVLIGAKDKKEKMPTLLEIEQMMAEFGWISGDEIAECFGEKGFAKLQKFLETKWKIQP